MHWERERGMVDFTTWIQNCVQLTHTTAFQVAFPRSYLHVEGPPAHAWKTGQSLGSALPCFAASPLGCHVRTLSPSSSSLGVAAPEPWGFFAESTTPRVQTAKHDHSLRRWPGKVTQLLQEISKFWSWPFQRPHRNATRDANCKKTWERTFTEHPRTPRIPRLQLHGLAANLLFFTCSARTSVFRTQEMVSKHSSASSFQVLPQRAWLDIVGPASSFKNRLDDAIPCHSTGAVPTSGIWAAEICLGSSHFDEILKRQFSKSTPP